MKVALALHPTKDQIAPHFGHAERFWIYDVESPDQYQRYELKVAEDHGQAKFKAMLDEAADVVIANGIGPGVMRFFDMTEMQVFAGVTGPAEEAFANYLSGNLISDPSAIRCCGGHH